MQEEALFIHERPRNCFVECIARQLQDHGMRKSRELSGICFFSVVFSSKKKKNSYAKVAHFGVAGSHLLQGLSVSLSQLCLLDFLSLNFL